MTRKPDDAGELEDLDGPGERVPFDDPAALDELRRNAFETIGLPWAIGVLYGVGMGQGLRDGLRLTTAFGGALSAQPEVPGAPIPMLFTPRGGRPGTRLAGALRHSLEARLHLSSYPEPADPICFVSSGYSAGWYSALLGEFYLVRETACLSRGAAECAFEARPAREWSGAECDWARELLPYLDYEQLVESAREDLALDGPDAEGEMLGGFDPLSPAAHVWGPVLVLPYSGSEDSLAAVEVIRADVGPEQLRVVVIDVIGVRIEAIEAAGLLRLVDALESLGLESVIAG
ncbi:MAG TPA: V4R domain-containing protein, partial [Myxococcota bacterium]|nr:V4R domain-containing protein [Myxococcota bacterium]